MLARRVKKTRSLFSFHEVEGFITFEYVLLPVILNYIFNVSKAFQVAHSFLVDARNLSRVPYKCYRHELSLLRRRQGQSEKLGTAIQMAFTWLSNGWLGLDRNSAL